MRRIILILLLANFIACRQKTSTITEREIDFTTQQELSNPPKEISFDGLEEILLPFCMKSNYVKDDLYYVDIDKFLGFHKLKKSLNKEVSDLFHKGTIDFLTYKDNPFYELIPYKQNEFDTPPFAIKKIQINDTITSILYVYIIEDGEPRIELQTVDKQGNYIDSIILYYRLANECSGERTFCIDKNFLIKTETKFGCTALEKDEEDFNFEQTDIFKITETGKIERQTN